MAALNVIRGFIIFHNTSFRIATARQSSTSAHNWAVSSTETSLRRPRPLTEAPLKHSKNCFSPPNFERAHVCSNERVNTDLTVLGGHAPVSETLGLDRLQGTGGLGCESKGKKKQGHHQRSACVRAARF